MGNEVGLLDIPRLVIEWIFPGGYLPRRSSNFRVSILAEFRLVFSNSAIVEPLSVVSRQFMNTRRQLSKRNLWILSRIAVDGIQVSTNTERGQEGQVL